MNQVCSYQHYGDEQVLEWVNIPRQKPRKHEIIVQIRAASINPVDWKIMAGEQKIFTGNRLRYPRIFGSDFSGFVETVGDVAYAARWGITVGTPVMGMVNPLRSGSFQQYLRIPANRCIPLAVDTDLFQAAGLPAAGTTAWMAWRALAPETWSGKTVLLNGAAGGVGSMILQLLAGEQAKVIAVASHQRHGMLQGLGALACYDYHNQLAIIDSAPWDALIDCHGTYLTANVAKLVRRGGLYIPVSIPNSLILPTIVKQAGYFLRQAIQTKLLLAAPSRQILTELAQILNQRKLKVCIDRMYTSDEIHQAVRQSIAGHVAGKIIVQFES